MSRAEDTAGTIERMLAIKALPLFADVHPDELAIVAEHAQVRTFRRGETLVPSIHLVLEGRLTEHRGGQPFRTHGPQQVVGGIDALALTPADVTVVADEDTTTLAIERADLRDILEDNFGVLSATLQGVAAAVLRLRRRLVPSAGFAERGVPDREAPAPLDELGARIVFLRALPWLGQGSIETLGQIAREATLVSLADGEPLWRERDPADHVMLVVGGVVVCATADDRQRFEGAPRAILGLEEALAIEPRWYGAVARGSVSLLRITQAAIVDALEDDPDTALYALGSLASVASRLRDRVAQMTTEAP